MSRATTAALIAALALGVSACGAESQPADSASAPASAEATPGSDTASQPAAVQGEPELATVALSDSISHVHGLVVGADGSLFAGTHSGVRIIGLDGAVAAVGPQDDLMGMTGRPGTDELLSSGHPGPGSAFPNPVGLIRSGDGGRTWESVSLAGQIDFHALATTGDYIVGFDGVSGIITSTDGGVTWQQGASLGAYALAAVGDDVWATTPDGLQRSEDRGASFAPVPGAPMLRLLSAGTDGSLWGLAADGTAWFSADGVEWSRHLALPEVQAIAALDGSTAYAVNQTTLVVLTR